MGAGASWGVGPLGWKVAGIKLATRPQDSVQAGELEVCRHASAAAAAAPGGAAHPQAGQCLQQHLNSATLPLAQASRVFKESVQGLCTGTATVDVAAQAVAVAVARVSRRSVDVRSSSCWCSCAPIDCHCRTWVHVLQAGGPPAPPPWPAAVALPSRTGPKLSSAPCAGHSSCYGPGYCGHYHKPGRQCMRLWHRRW